MNRDKQRPVFDVASQPLFPEQNLEAFLGEVAMVSKDFGNALYWPTQGQPFSPGIALSAP